MTEGRTRTDVLRLLMEHRGSLFAFIHAMVRDFDLAEDVFQDVSVAVCESYRDFRPGSNFPAWAREIARRRVLARWRRDARFPDLLPEESLRHLAAGFDEAEAGWRGRERLAALRACIETLGPVARRLLELRFAGCLKLDEIAEQLGRKSESVRKGLYRTRRHLRQCVQQRLRLEETS